MGFLDGGGGGGGFGGAIGGVNNAIGSIPVVGSTINKFNPFAEGNIYGDMLKRATPKNNFQAEKPELINQQNFAGALQQAQGNAGMAFSPGAGGAPSFAQQLMNNYGQAQGQQQNLINSLQQQAAGQGPGAQLAQNQLHQATQQNNAQAAGMIASQKGINPALAARLSGQNMTAANQQAAAQGANLGLEQQLAAQNQLGQQLNQNQQLQGNMFGNVLQGAGNQFSTLQQANTAQNQQGINASLGAQGLNQSTQAGNAAELGKIEGGILGGAGAAGAAKAGAAKGGKVPGKALFSGDDARNDTVNAVLSPGEVVMPRTAMSDRNKAIAFLDALKAGESGWQQPKKKKKE